MTRRLIPQKTARNPCVLELPSVSQCHVSKNMAQNSSAIRPSSTHQTQNPCDGAMIAAGTRRVGHVEKNDQTGKWPAVWSRLEITIALTLVSNEWIRTWLIWALFLSFLLSILSCSISTDQWMIAYWKVASCQYGIKVLPMIKHVRCLCIPLS